MKTTSNFLDKVLPTYGNQRENIPIYDDGRKMFLSNTYTSESGNMYYRGIRFSERLVMVEYVGIYKSWTYIDKIELFAFNGTNRELIGRKEFSKEFYKQEELRVEVEELTLNYLKSQMALSNGQASEETLQLSAKQITDEMYQNQIDNIKKLAAVSKLMLGE